MNIDCTKPYKDTIVPLSTLKHDVVNVYTDHQVIVLSQTLKTLNNKKYSKVNSKVETADVLRVFVVADMSGYLELFAYIPKDEVIRNGDILFLTKCFPKFHHENLTLNISRWGKILRIGSFCMNFKSEPSLRVAYLESPYYQEWLKKNPPNNQLAPGNETIEQKPRERYHRNY